MFQGDLGTPVARTEAPQLPTMAHGRAEPKPGACRTAAVCWHTWVCWGPCRDQGTQAWVGQCQSAGARCPASLCQMLLTARAHHLPLASMAPLQGPEGSSRLLPASTPSPPGLHSPGLHSTAIHKVFGQNEAEESLHSPSEHITSQHSSPTKHLAERERIWNVAQASSLALLVPRLSAGLWPLICKPERVGLCEVQ